MNHIQAKPRFPWKKEEDKALKYLIQDLKIEKWTEVAEKLNSLNQIHSRNHQQCRDRYVNFLQIKIQNKKWPQQDFHKLIDLYIIYGNKWSEIANHFENINGLLIKNKFYSRLRKGIRNINFLIQSFLSESWEKFNFNMIFKLINCAANKFDFSQKCALGKKIQQRVTFVQEIVKQVFDISWLDKCEIRKAFKSKKVKNFHWETIDKLIQDINFVDQNFDKKHSNRRILIKKPLSSNPIQINVGRNEKSVSLGNDTKVEKNKIRNSCLEYNHVAYPIKKQYIQIVSVNSFDKKAQIQIYENECGLQRAYSTPEECEKRRDSAKRIATRYSGYRQHKYEDIKYQAHCIPQSKFFDGQSFYQPNNLKAQQVQIDRACLN